MTRPARPAPAAVARLLEVAALAALVALVALVALAPSPALAAPGDLPEAGWRTLEVGVLPVVAYVRGADDLFEERPAARRLRERAGAWQRRLEAQLAGLDLVRVLAREQVAKRLGAARGARETLAVARERFDLGLDRYRQLALDDAQRQLERAAGLYDEALADLTEAREMADVQLYLGLTLMEQGEPNRAHVAFRTLFLLDPWRRVEKGYYPEATERAMAGALVDLAALPDKVGTLHPPQRLADLAARAGVDGWIVPVIEGTAEAPVLRLVAFDAASRSALVDARVPLGDGLDDEAAANDLVDRALSAWHTCAVSAQERPFVVRRRTPRWSVAIGYAHTLLLRHRQTRDLFHSPGARLGVAWQVGRLLELYAEVMQMTSLPDRNRDLVDSFVTSRVRLGAGLSAGSRRLRFLLRAGPEVAVAFSDIEMTTDVDCKHFGADSPRCTRRVAYEAPAVWFGMGFSAGLRWWFVEDWHLTVLGDGVSYVASRELARDLNFPITLGVAVGAGF